MLTNGRVELCLLCQNRDESSSSSKITINFFFNVFIKFFLTKLFFSPNTWLLRGIVCGARECAMKQNID